MCFGGGLGVNLSSGPELQALCHTHNFGSVLGHYSARSSSSVAAARESQKASSTARSHWSSAEWCRCCALTLCRRPAEMTRLAVCEQVHKLPVQPLHRLGTSLQLCQQQSSSDCYVLIYLGPQGGKSQRHPCRAVDILCERDLNVCLQGSLYWLSQVCHSVQTIPHCSANQDAVGRML